MIKVDEVVEICQAYELGYSAGRMNLSSDSNDFNRESEQYYAWMIGHNTGIQLELMEVDEMYVN